jgi:hypothetical protein
MAQKFNLNINPYYDDFDKNANFYKVLFKPGFPVQARELTTLQSILQNQIESFGSHIFKEGSMVIPGSITYDDKYFSVIIDPTHFGTEVTLYIAELVGKKIQGQDSGAVAVIKNFSLPPDEGVENITLYVKYLSSGTDSATSQFISEESLVLLEENVVYSGITINFGNTVATVSSGKSTYIGSAVNLERGVYFIRGMFVDVPNSVVILDPYSNLTSYRVGLTVQEELISSYEDSTLNDNAKGFTNYAAPGADRLKITAFLSKKLLNDFDDKNFIEIVRVQNGIIKKIQDTTTYSLIKDYIAKRTYDESGDYAIDKFDIEVLESLNDRISNNGVYLDTETTQSDGIPSEDKVCIKVSPGKAYVRGYDIVVPSTVLLDVPKTRDTNTKESTLVPFNIGSLLRVNNVNGTPYINPLDQNNIINLYNQRLNSLNSGTGTLIGKARVYSYSLTDAAYSDDSTSWDLYLYDIQTITKLTINEEPPNNLVVGSFIRGLNTGASGYVDSISGNILYIIQTSGKFSVGESFYINESLFNSRSIVSIQDYTSDDIRSVWQDCSTITSGDIPTDFVADVVLKKKVASGFRINDEITITPSGNVTSAGRNFTGIRSDTIIRYQIPGNSTETFNRVDSVSIDGLSLTLASCPVVSNVCNGSLPGVTTSVSFGIGFSDIKDDLQAPLYSPLFDKNISSVNLSDANLVVNAQIKGLTSDALGQLTCNVTSSGVINAFFENFDSDRYSLIYSDGTVEDLTYDQFEISFDGTQITINGLNALQNNITLNATLRKFSVQNVSKTFVRSERIIVDRTSLGGGNSNVTGLTSSFWYGTRVEDLEISLNVPDVVNVVAVHESLDTSDPTLDSLTIVASLDLDTKSIIGEQIIGSSSGAVAQLVTRNSSTKVSFVYLNKNVFQIGETVTFKDSGIVSEIQLLEKGNYIDRTSNYILDKGHKRQYCDYSRVVRKDNSSAPVKRLGIVFNYFDVLSNNKGDFATANSYDVQRFSKDVPILPNGERSSDVLDFRPRVVKYTSGSGSPFDFNERVFDTGVSPFSIKSGESSLIGYDYYLPRIDRVVLNSLGEISVIKGSPSDTPKIPVNVEDAMDLASIYLPAYLYDVRDAKVTLIDNKRYTMRDVGKLEDRIKNLEILTSLSLLELDTKSLQIQDSDGLTRFKSGFFVDDFKTRSLIDFKNPDVKVDVDTVNREMTSCIDSWSLKAEIAPPTSTDSSVLDFSQNIPLLDPNTRKTGDLVTLNYIEEGWLEQPLASNVENVNPFAVLEYIGKIKINPSADNWVRNVYTEEGRVISTGAENVSEYVESVILNSDVDPYLRSRNYAFSADSLKSFTQHYGFLDDVSSVDIIPKLLEITMISGTFTSGELIEGFIGSNKVISFRTAVANHKFGPYDQPTKVYTNSPYDRTTLVPSSYSSSSTVLNIDLESLTEESSTTYGGYVTTEVVLTGKTSGATAKVSNNRLITDKNGDLLGSFFIREPNSTPQPQVKFKSGQKQFRLSSIPSGSSVLPGDITLSSNAFGTFLSTGIIQTQLTSVVQVRYQPPADPIYSAPVVETEYVYVPTTQTSIETPVQAGTAPATTPATKPNTIYVNSKGTVYNEFSQDLLVNLYYGNNKKNKDITDLAKAAGIKNIDIGSNGNLSQKQGNRIRDFVANKRNLDLQSAVTIRSPKSLGGLGISINDKIPLTALNTGNNISFNTNTTNRNSNNNNNNNNNKNNNNNNNNDKNKGDSNKNSNTNTGNSSRDNKKCKKNDPLAQTFTTDPGNGFFLTSIDVYFATKDPVEKITVELRTVELGTPTDLLVQDYSRVSLESDDINVSDDASLPTKITFPSPVYLQGDTEYAIVLLSPTTDKYQVWTGTMGSKTIESKNLPDVESVVIGRQYLGGSLFKSQNGTIWSPNQYQDIKFRLYRAKFTVNSGQVVFYNPSLPYSDSQLIENPISILPRKLKVGITTTNAFNSILTVGRKVSEGPNISNPGPYGYIEKVGGPLNTGTIVNSGIGYANGTYSAPLYSITGSGTGAVADVSFSNGILDGLVITNSGTGYAVGDILGITTASVGKGRNATISVSSTNGQIDTLYLTDVQGEEFTDTSKLLYRNNSDTAYVVAGTVTINGASSNTNPIYSGNVLKISQINHGMHGDGNKVSIKDVEPDSPVVYLTSAFSNTDSTLFVSDATSFTTFEGLSGSSGYIKINGEIMYYSSVDTGSNTLTITTRGVSGTTVRSHSSGDFARKYEIGNVSLTRINKNLDLPLSSLNPTLKNAIDLDFYYLEFDRDDRSSGDTQISFSTEKTLGGSQAKISQNHQYSSIIPQFNIITPGSGTSAYGLLRSVSGTSCGGNEVPFIDQGFENIQLNAINYLSTPRLLCSQINESTQLSSLPKNKSVSINIVMERAINDYYVSPVIDLQTAYMTLGRSRLNNPVSDYATDSRVNLSYGDPHSSIYISNRINLKQTATSLKVLVSACRPFGSDFRVLYKIFKPDLAGVDPAYLLFPGYTNLKDENGDGFGDVVVDQYLNNGLPDAKVKESSDGEFLEYQFTADNLDPFIGFSIKIVMSSTNESSIVKFKDLRVIALA